MSTFTLISPFPLVSLTDCYEWHRYTTTVINSRALGQADFMIYMLHFLKDPACRSWGLVDSAGECVGLILADPIYRGWELIDANIHIALARCAWGRGAIDNAASVIIPALFGECPTLAK